MTAVVMTEALRRLQGVNHVLRIVAAAENPQNPDAGTRAAKGLVFVHMYAVYEYSLTEGVREVLREFNRRSLPLRDIHRALLPLALEPDFGAVRMASVDRTWEVRAALVNRCGSQEVASIHESLFPKDGSFFRTSQLRLLWSILNLPTPVLPVARLQSHIEELVSNRNDIAHGTRAPEDVGQRYTLQDLFSRVQDTELLCSHVLSSFGRLIGDAGSFR